MTTTNAGCECACEECHAHRHCGNNKCGQPDCHQPKDTNPWYPRRGPSQIGGHQQDRTNIELKGDPDDIARAELMNSVAGQQAGDGWEERFSKLPIWPSQYDSKEHFSQTMEAIKSFIASEIARATQKADATANFKGYMDGLANGKVVGRAEERQRVGSQLTEFIAEHDCNNHTVCYFADKISDFTASLLTNNQQPK